MEGSSEGLRKGAWTAEEDSLLRQCIDKYGEGKWNKLPLRAGLNRCSKSCRERWLNYLKPSIKRGKFGSDEVELLIRLHKLLGNRWSLIAGRLPGRTANDVKNFWTTHFGKKQEPCCTSKTRKRYITCSAASPAQNLSVIKPRPQSYNRCSQLIGQKEVELGEVSNKDGSITYNKDEFMNSLMDGESMWWESLLEESQVADGMGPVATTTKEADNFFINSMFSTLDVEQLWSLFNSDTREVDKVLYEFNNGK